MSAAIIRHGPALAGEAFALWQQAGRSRALPTYHDGWPLCNLFDRLSLYMYNLPFPSLRTACLAPLRGNSFNI